MAHELDFFTDGRARMAYVGELPWHGHGQALTPGADLETWVREAGMEWDVRPSPVCFRDPAGELREWPDRMVLHRSDTGLPLGVVSDGYRIVQPREVVEFFRELCARHGFAMETAGVLRAGARYWALARTGLDADTAAPGQKSDPAALYVLLASSADGGMSTIAQPTGVRVVCANTWRAALGADGKGDERAVKVSHRGAFDPKAVHARLGFTVEDLASAWSRNVDTLRAMGARTLTPAEAARVFVELLRPPKEGEAAPELAPADLAALWAHRTRWDGRRASSKGSDLPRGLKPLWECYEGAPGARPGTARGVFEAVTYYVDHERGSDSSKRLDSAFWGQGADLKARAFEACAALAAA